MRRRPVSKRAGRALALLGLVAASACGGGEADAADPDPQRRDPRIAPLFAGCVKSDFYDRNLADVLPILVEKLERSAREPLTRAKEELGDAGEAAIPEVARLIRRHFSEPHGGAVLSNALDVLKRNDSEGAHDLLIQCLDHPGASVRLGAIQALQLSHAEPGDFDVLLAHLDIEVPEQRHQVVLALHASDPARAEDLYLDWVEDAERPGTHRYVAPVLARSKRPETARRAGELFEDAELAIASYLAAPAARAGSEKAHAFLAGELARRGEPGDLARRTYALGASVEAGLEDLLVQALGADPDGQLRAVAADGLRGLDELSDAGREALALGLDDLKPTVRSACLGALVERGDPAAIDRALALLEGTTASMQEGMSALFRRMPDDPATARRVFETLAARDELEDFLPLSERLATLKSLGQVPTAEAAQLLRRRALEHVDERVESLRAHEWMMIHAANTGDAGRTWLIGELANEADPVRRIDLLWAGTGARTQVARETLIELVQGDALTPDELLFACDRLLSLGPAAEVAPLLKRLAPRIEDAEVRVALQCMLWSWY